MTTNHCTAAEIIAELAKLFPRAFSTDPSNIQPLAVGLKERLLEQYTRSPESIDNALRDYTGSMDYLKGMIEGAARVDLDGKAAGLVTLRQAKVASRRLAAMAGTVAPKYDDLTTCDAANCPVAVHDRIVTKVAATESTLAPQVSASPATPRRLGLSDLKRAAAARRSVSV